MAIKKEHKKKLLFIIPIFLLIFGGLCFTNFNLASIYDSGTGEMQYQEIVLDNTGKSALTDYPIEIIIPYSANMQNDFDDVRFYDSENNLLKHYKDSYSASSTATFLVQISIDADSTKTIYMYSGNPDAVDASDTSIYMLYDDFSTDTISTYTLTEASGSHAISYDSGNERMQYSTTTAGYSFATKDIAGTTNGFIMEMDVTLGGTHTGYGAFFVDPSATTAEFVLCRHDAVSDLIRFDTFNAGWSYAGGTSVALASAAGETHHVKNVFNSANNQGKCYVDGTYYLSDTLSHPTGEIGFVNYDGTSYFDNLKIRKYIIDEPIVLLGSKYNEDGKIFDYFIEDNLDFTIPTSSTGSGTETFYVTHADGYNPNANAVYDYYDDCTSLDGWSGSTGYLSITDDGLKMYEVTSSSYTVYKDLGGSHSDFIFEFKQKKHSTGHNQGSLVELLPTNALTNRFTESEFWYSGGWIWRAYSAGGFTNFDTAGAYDTWYICQQVVRNTDSQWDYYVYNVDGSLKSSDTGNSWAVGSPSGSVTYLGMHTPSIDYTSTTYEWFKIRKYTANPPTAIVTDYGSYYKIVITNNEITPLTNHQITIDGTELGITATDDSLLISENPPISLTNESITPNSTESGNNIVLSAIFSNTVQDVNVTIGLPDNSTELVALSNIENNMWNTTLNYTDIGNYTINNYKINSESITIDSSLAFNITEAIEEETPTVPSSSGGGGSTYVPPVVEEETVVENESISNNLVDDTINKVNPQINDTETYLFITLFVVVGILSYLFIKRNN